MECYCSLRNVPGIFMGYVSHAEEDGQAICSSRIAKTSRTKHREVTQEGTSQNLRSSRTRMWREQDEQEKRGHSVSEKKIVNTFGARVEISYTKYTKQRCTSWTKNLFHINEIRRCDEAAENQHR